MVDINASSQASSERDSLLLNQQEITEETNNFDNPQVPVHQDQRSKLIKPARSNSQGDMSQRSQPQKSRNGRSTSNSNARKSNSSKNLGGSAKESKEKKYYHVGIAKLAEAFEQQFFGSIEQFQAFDTNKNNQLRSQSIQQLGAEKSGRTRVFQNMTIHTQYNDYHELKNLMYSQLKSVNRFGNLLICIGIVYLMYLTISLFFNNSTFIEPVTCMISHAVIFGSDLDEIVSEDYQGWTIIIFKITGFMCSIIYIVLGCYIAYYRSVIKVDTIKQIMDTSLYCLASFTIIGFVHSVFCIYFAIADNFTVVNIVEYPLYDVEGKEVTAQVFAITIQVIFYFFELTAFVLTYNAVKKTHATMLKFHDYLIKYRLTPRSRILRKHLPKMTMVLEEQESMMDSSSIMMSQSRLMSVRSVSQQTSLTKKERKKFVYYPPEANLPQYNPDGSVLLDPNQEEDTSSSGDEGQYDNGDDMEHDLMALDTEQADFIRKINQGGSMAFHNTSVTMPRRTQDSRSVAGPDTIHAKLSTMRIPTSPQVRSSADAASMFRSNQCEPEKADIRRSMDSSINQSPNHSPERERRLSIEIQSTSIAGGQQQKQVESTDAQRNESINHTEPLQISENVTDD